MRSWSSTGLPTATRGNLLFGILPICRTAAADGARSESASRGNRREELNGRYRGDITSFSASPWSTGGMKDISAGTKRGRRDGAGPPAPQPETGLYVEAGDPAALRACAISLPDPIRTSTWARRGNDRRMMHPLNAKIDGAAAWLFPDTDCSSPVYPWISRLPADAVLPHLRGQGGIDPYGSTTRDVYHDLFDEGSFTGRAYSTRGLLCLLGRPLPHNGVLSHDL